MANFPNDDLFESSKMSFGEHLEELRVSLFKAVVGLVIGFAVGLMVAHHVMNFVQRPLKLALENYYIDKAVEDLSTLYEGKVDDPLRAFIRDKRLVFEEMLVESSEFRRVGQIVQAEQANLLKTTDKSPPDKSHQPDITDTPNVKDQPGKFEQPDKSSKSTQPEVSANPAESKSAATGSSTPAASKPSATSADANASASSPSATATVDKSAKAGQANSAGSHDSLQIVGETIPSPSSNLVKARVWKPVRMDVRALNAQEAFMIWMKAGFISGAIFASPWIFWQIWRFVAAGLYPHEKNYVYMYLPFSLLLFLAGASMAFFFVFEPVLAFLFSFNKSLNIDPDPRISEWLGFVLILPLGFGISFQLPLVMLFLNRIGLLSLEIYVQKWRIAVLAIFVISAILTPADPISIFLMAVPLTLLYFLGLGLCKWMPRSKNPYAEAYEP